MKIDTWDCDQVCASGFSLARKACYVTVENHDKSAKFGRGWIRREDLINYCHLWKITGFNLSNYLSKTACEYLLLFAACFSKCWYVEMLICINLWQSVHLFRTALILEPSVYQHKCKGIAIRIGWWMSVHQQKVQLFVNIYLFVSKFKHLLR